MIKRDIIDIAMQPGLSELKLHLRITSNDQDALLLLYLKSAARAAEKHIGRCLLKSNYTIAADFAPSLKLEGIDPDFFPLVGSPKVLVDGAEVTAFEVKGSVLTFEDSVAGTSVVVKYTAGGMPVEEDIRAAIMLTAAKYFNNPVDSVETLPSVASNLLRPYRNWGTRDGE